MRAYKFLFALPILLTQAPAVQAQVGVQIAAPAVSVQLNLGGLPALTPVPGLPVYYAPGVASNYFYYDGMFWLFRDDVWYASSWYNGPWEIMQPAQLPPVLLQVPVRYFRVPPPYFRGWAAGQPPRWNERFGPAWVNQHPNWNRRQAAVPPAPIPTYQRGFAGGRYPHDVNQQRAIRQQNWRYQPREAVVRQHMEGGEREGARR